ncbi:MAG: hypothetical protein M3Y53_01040 [Thermoproteota archaeon]|nr:hypothetical protein [Thermoproteota archaeon]
MEICNNNHRSSVRIKESSTFREISNNIKKYRSNVAQSNQGSLHVLKEGLCLQYTTKLKVNKTGLLSRLEDR